MAFLGYPQELGLRQALLVNFSRDTRVQSCDRFFGEFGDFLLVQDD